MTSQRHTHTIVGCVDQVEIIKAFHDWLTILAPLSIQVSGVSIQRQCESVNHSFRFIQRRDVKNYISQGMLGFDVGSVSVFGYG